MTVQGRDTGAKLLRETWISGVHEFLPAPKSSWITPWDQMEQEGRQWEQNILRFLWQILVPVAQCNPDLDREVGGQLVRDAWRLGVYSLLKEPKPASIGPWSDMQEWERETDRRMWEVIVLQVRRKEHE